MKKLLFLAALLVASASAFAQGTVNINNRVTASGIDAPIFDIDGSTRLAGAGFLAQLYVGDTAVGAAVNFRTGAGAGYIVNTDTVRTITGIAAGGAATVTLRAWDAAFSTYEAALNGGGKYGSSLPVTLASTGNPTANPPGTPVDLVGLQSFSLVPEPSTIALAMLGGAALFLRRRK